MPNQTINQTISSELSSEPTKSPQQTLVSWILDFLLYHSITLGVIALICLAFLVNHYGAKKNLRIATKAKNKIHNFLKSNFTNYTGEFIDQAPNIIKLYASGRDSCIFAIFAFALIPRQQIASFFLNSIFFNLKDQLVIQVPIKTSLTLTLAIVRRKNIREITKKRYPDLKQLCKEYKPTNKTAYNVPETHSILVEKRQHVPYLLTTQKQVQTWHKHARMVKLFYLSDINKFSRYPMALRMVINLSQDQIDTEKCDGLVNLLQWMLSFVDRMSKVKMSFAEKREAKKKREGIDDVYDQF